MSRSYLTHVLYGGDNCLRVYVRGLIVWGEGGGGGYKKTSCFVALQNHINMSCCVLLTAPSIPHFLLQNILFLLLFASMLGQLQPPSSHTNIAHENNTNQRADVWAYRIS